MTSGYYRFPTIHNDTVIFVSEDDLWTVSSTGGLARRLTNHLGDVSYPSISPDGAWVAFVGREEGTAEVYLMPASGGEARRMTFLGSRCRVLGWSADSQQIIFASSYGRPYRHENFLYTIDIATRNGEMKPLPYGPAQAVTFGPQGQVVLGRNNHDPARWKRYRGGEAGQLWIDPTGSGQFVRLLADLIGNVALPMWIESATPAIPAAPAKTKRTARSKQTASTASTSGRIYFVSDHEGVGNLYSCLPDGADLRRHTDHEDYYVRHPSSDGKRIIYHAGADLWVYEIASDTTQRIAVDYHSPRVQRNRKFVDAARYMDSARLHPSGKAITVTTRGKLYTFFNHEGPVLQLGRREGVHYRLPEWFNDGRRLFVISDESGEEAIEIRTGNPSLPCHRLEGLDIGRALTVKISPAEDRIAITNHRHELLVVDLSGLELDFDKPGAAAPEPIEGQPSPCDHSWRITVLDRSPHKQINGIDWSPDGRWLAYGFPATKQTTEIRLCYVGDEAPTPDSAKPPEAGNGQPPAVAPTPPAAAPTLPPADGNKPAPRIYSVTRPVRYDVRPSFDPEGNFLYFLSYREFNPVYDGLQFEIGFPWGMRPYLITLRADQPNPFVPHPEQEEDDERNNQPKEQPPAEPPKPAGGGEQPPEPPPPPEEPEEPDDNRPTSPAGSEENSDSDSAPAPSPIPGEPTAPTDEVPAPTADAQTASATEQTNGAAPKPKNNFRRLRIDLAGIERRVIPFPVPDGRYQQVTGIPGKALFTSYEIHGAFDDGHHWEDEARTEHCTLRSWIFKEYRSETVIDNVSGFSISRNCKKLLYSSSWRRLRVIAAGEKTPNDNSTSRRGGWLDLNRIRVSVEPQSEWEQMMREAWRLQRDYFWAEDMSEIDWHAVYHRYFPLIERVSTRSEFSDLLWEMQGELGTSHAYESGGDYRGHPHYNLGHLGADFQWDGEAGGYRVQNITAGDSWNSDEHSPLLAPGVDVQPNDLLVAINGQPLDAATSPAQMLVSQAGYEVLLTFAERKEHTTASSETLVQQPNNNGATPSSTASVSPPIHTRLRHCVVPTLYREDRLRYRAWVNNNRQQVHEATEGRVGYLHIPDMQVHGFAEFHRGFLVEIDRQALIVDVRYNAGGHVSQLILEKLARRRIGYDLSRWGGLSPYPDESVAGPLVALINEHTASDGDIFAHSFKLMKLGPLIGKRTWGGVVGYYPRQVLVDGASTTQPESSSWFEDIGWGLENRGTEPTIEVDIAPQDYAAGREPQLARAIAEALRLLDERPVLQPTLHPRPSRAHPKLPPR